jgi:hypothetical protein
MGRYDPKTGQSTMRNKQEDSKKTVIFFHDVRNTSKIIIFRVSRGAVCRRDPPSNTDIAVICLLLLQSAGLGHERMCIGAVGSDKGSGRVFTKHHISM